LYESHKKEPVFLDTLVLKNVLQELKENGVRAVEFVGGGEPTTHKDVAELIKYAADLGLDVGLVTNGMLLHRIFDVADCLTFVRVSLDAATASTYEKTHGSKSFDKVLDNLNQLTRHMNPEKIGCGYLIVPDNVEEIIQAAALVKEIGCRFIQYRPATLPYPVEESIWKQAQENVQIAISTYGGENFQVFNAGIKWNHTVQERRYSKCHTSPLVAVLKATGDLALCILNRNNKDRYIGNIYDGGFFKHWGSERHYQLVNSIDVHCCPKPCKHDSYNIVAEGIRDKLFHKNFI
jgi:cyclic pyranopterin phosphate synthase